MYRQFGHAPTKGIASPVMKYVVMSVVGCTLNAHKPSEAIRELNIRNINDITVGEKFRVNVTVMLC